METIKTIHEKAFSHKCYDKNYNFLGYGYGYPTKYITEEEKAEAQKQLEELKKQKQAEYENGDFWLCAMGMDKEGDFNNHRARANFIAPDGKSWFVEFSTYQTKGMKQEELHLDFLKNNTLEREYDQKIVEIREKNKDKFFYGWSKKDRGDREKYNKQPYYWEKYHEAAELLKGKPATRGTALNMINTIFKTKFNNLQIIDYLIPSDWENRD